MPLLLFLLFLSFLAYGGDKSPTTKPAPVETTKIEKATFAGGCFWCMEAPFDEVDGVISTISGYSGGKTENPTYKDVSNGGTGHKEVMQVTYDASKVSYEKLVSIYWKNIDPFDGLGQFCDQGSQYATAIFYHSEEQKKIALQSREKLFAAKEIKGKVMTEVIPLTKFYEAEDYHQDYYKKNPLKYKAYRYSCQRDKRLKEVWGDSK